MKVLLFDDHKLLGESLTRALNEFSEIEVCDFVDNERSFYKTLKTFQYDVILLDINLKEASNLNGFEILEKIKNSSFDNTFFTSLFHSSLKLEKIYK